MQKEYKVGERLSEHVEISPQTCPIHGIYLWKSVNKVKAIDNAEPHYVLACPMCIKPKTEQEKADSAYREELNAELATSYALLETKSIIPPKLKEASYKTFTVSNDTDKKARDFGLYLNEYYFKQGGKGNSIVQGSHGVGKSHLTISIARKLNEDFKAIGEPKSVLFYPVANLFRMIESGADYNENQRNQGQMMKLLTGVDFLFLDDLGKESTFVNQGKEAANSRQRFLFELLDSRVRTIVNTNLTGEQLKKTYDSAIVSRLMEGVGRNFFTYPKTAEDKRRLPF